MSPIVFCIIGVNWHFIGAAGFIFWWTKEHDVQLGDLFMCFLTGLAFGPFTWLVGYALHGNKDKPAVLFKKRP